MLDIIVPCIDHVHVVIIVILCELNKCFVFILVCYFHMQQARLTSTPWTVSEGDFGSQRHLPWAAAVYFQANHHVPHCQTVALIGAEPDLVWVAVDLLELAHRAVRPWICPDQPECCQQKVKWRTWFSAHKRLQQDTQNKCHFIFP